MIIFDDHFEHFRLILIYLSTSTSKRDFAAPGFGRHEQTMRASASKRPHGFLIEKIHSEDGARRRYALGLHLKH